MFSNIKSRAKTILFQNYRNFFILILIYELFSIANAVLFSFGLSAKRGIFLSTLLIVFLIFIKMFVLPFLTFLCFKIVVSADKGIPINTAIKSFLTYNNFLKIAVISFVPSVVSLTYSFTKHFEPTFENKAVYSFVIFALMVIRVFTDFKFLACGYHFVASNLSVKETINSSFKTMKFKFWNYTLYTFSFVLWGLLLIVIIVVGILLFRSLKFSPEYIQLLVPSGFGFMFFYRPYKFICDLLYVENINQKQKKTR